MKQYFSKNLSDGLILDKEIFSVQDFAIHKDKNGNPYYRIELQDKSGDVAGKVWSDSIQFCNISEQNIGDVVEITGIVSEYQGKLQITIKKCEITEVYNLEDLIQVTDKGIDNLFKQIQNHIDTIKDAYLKELFTNMFSDETFINKFKEAPAAEKIHHDFVGGLMEHILELLDLSDTVKKQYPEANYDLVKSGIILHDIGKTVELERIGTTFQRTTLGKIIGHLPISIEVTKEYLPEDFPEDLWMHLWHILLSHHGLLEYGSPIVPKTIEAGIVHQLDYMSSKIRQYSKALSVAEGDNEFTNYERTLGTDLFAVPYISAETKIDKSNNQQENNNIDPDQAALI